MYPIKLSPSQVDYYKNFFNKRLSDKYKTNNFIKSVFGQIFEKNKIAVENAAQKKVTEELSAKMKIMEDEAKRKTQQVQELQKKELELAKENEEKAKAIIETQLNEIRCMRSRQGESGVGE